MPKLQNTMGRVVTAAGLMLAGLCGCNTPKDNLMEYNSYFERGELKIASGLAMNKLHKCGNPRGEDLLWALQLGVIERMEGRFAESTAWFDKAEDMMQYFASQNPMGQNAVAAAINDNSIPYKGSIYDGIMVNTYKALNFIQEDKPQLARVEFNRALDRQRRAKEDFAAQIQARKDDLDADNNNQLAQKSLENKEFREKLERTYPSIYNFEAYPDFVNPFTTYLAGVFFAATGDYERAADSLKECAGMLPENSMIWEDFDAVEAVLERKSSSLSPTVWVFFENGLGPVKEEFRIDLPLFIATDRMLYYGIALPRLAFRPAAAADWVVQADGQLVKTALIADMDRVVQTEFKKDFDAILLRAILSSTAKAITQYALFKNTHNNDIWTIGMALYSFATTAADVRIWTSLPKTVETARLAMPSDRRLTLTTGRAAPVTIELGDCWHAIVMVRQITPAATPIVDVIRFF